MEKIIDLSIKLSPGHNGFGDDTSWERANQFGEMVRQAYAGRTVSAGTGFGYRDIQIHTELTCTEDDVKNKIAEWAAQWDLEMDPAQIYLTNYTQDQ